MLEAFRILEEEKHINKEDIIDAVKESLKSAYKRRYGQSESCVIEFDDKKGDFKVYTVREVVEEVFDSRLEISLSDALKISSAYELGDKIRFEESVAEFGRVAAQSSQLGAPARVMVFSVGQMPFCTVLQGESGRDFLTLAGVLRSMRMG